MSYSLNIDPGPTHSGVCFYDLARAVPTAFGWLTNAEVLDRIRHGRKLGFTHCIVERIKARGMAVGHQAAFDTAEYAGRCLQRAEDCGLTAEGLYQDDVRLHVCGTMRAKPSNIRAALIDRFGGEAATKKSTKCSRKRHEGCPKCDGSGRIGADGILVQMVGDHTVSALGVAVTWGDKHRGLPFSP